MPIAIHTKYIGPTHVLGARVKASAMHGGRLISITVPYAHESSDAHSTAAAALRDKYWPHYGSIVWAGNTLDDKGSIYALGL